MSIPTRQDMKTQTPAALREALRIARAEVKNYYDLFRMASSAPTRKAAQRGYRLAYRLGEAYIMELRRRKCTIPALEVPQKPYAGDQISLFEEVEV